MTDRRSDLRAAAFAAANWACARRATWTGVGDAAPLPPSAIVEGLLDPVPALPSGPAEWPRAFTLVADALSIVRPALVLAVIKQTLTLAAALVAVFALAVLGRAYWQQAMKTDATARLRAAAALASLSPKPPPAAIDRSTGGVRVATNPVPARVIIDGKPRGMTPLLVEHLEVGSHAVILESARGTVEASVRITGGETQDIDESIYSGWLMLFTPFDVTVTERGRAIAFDEKHQLLLPPGAHDLRFENRALEYVETRHVAIKPGAVASLSLASPKSTLSVTSDAQAQVWVDGKLMGGTPLEAVPIDLGTHTVVAKRTNGDVRQRSVNVTTKPLNLQM